MEMQSYQISRENILTTSGTSSLSSHGLIWISLMETTVPAMVHSNELIIFVLIIYTFILYSSPHLWSWTQYGDQKREGEELKHPGGNQGGVVVPVCLNKPVKVVQAPVMMRLGVSLWRSSRYNTCSRGCAWGRLTMHWEGFGSSRSSWTALLSSRGSSCNSPWPCWHCDPG